LRHTLASLLLESNTPLPAISDILGHVDTESTAVYLKVDIKKLVTTQELKFAISFRFWKIFRFLLLSVSIIDRITAKFFAPSIERN